MRIDTLIDDLRRLRQPAFSFEFFPPKTDDGERSLFNTVAQLRELEPTFVSVTYGAGGSARTHTLDVVTRIRRELDIEPMAHFTCVGCSRDELCDVLDAIRDSGIDNVLALRGDPPNGEAEFVASPGGLAHGSDLVALINGRYSFCVGAACYVEKHIESESLDDDVRYARLKVDNGAKFLITQLFFDNRRYFEFLGKARSAGVDVPIIPGIMPITNVDQIQRFTSKIGAAIPRALLDALVARKDDPDAVIQLGVAWATLQCAELLAQGAPGIHFYTLNRSPATRAILSALRAAKPWERAG